jgi:hypothetical protein
MADRRSTSVHWDKQAPAADPADVVNYSGSVAAGLRFETADGRTVALDPASLTDLFDTLRRHNPLRDGGASDTDRLRQWFADRIATSWNVTEVDSESNRLHRVLRAEGLELPHIRSLDAVQAIVGHEVIFFDRRNVCLARLTSMQADDAPADDTDPAVRIDFEVIPRPELEWAHGSPFTVGASEDFLQVQRGCFDIAMTNVCVITAAELIADLRHILLLERDPLARIPAIRQCLERRWTQAAA